MSPAPERASAGSCRQRCRDRSGFTLIEVLVAFVVLATLLSVLYRSVVQTRTGALVFDAHTRGGVVARAVLADLLARRDLPAGTYSGQRDGVSWTATARALDLASQLPPPPPPPPVPPGAPAPAAPSTAPPRWGPQRVVVLVATGGRPLHVETVHLVTAEPAR